jgi:glycosyltransferase involved in cell wall biosynthesis
VITVITINKDDVRGLRRTVNSVVDQSYRDYKHIVVDGSSSDGSIDYIQSLARMARVTHLYDRGLGIYSAMNIGLMTSTSKYVFFLNSGDVFSSCDSLMMLARFSGRDDVVYGMVTYEKGNSLNIYDDQCADVYFGKRYQHNIPSLASSLLLREKVVALKGFNTRYKICSDVELMYKIALSGGTFRCVPQPIVIFDLTGISSRRPLVATRERLMILLDVKPAYIFCFMYVLIGYLAKKLVSILKAS